MHPSQLLALLAAAASLASALPMNVEKAKRMELYPYPDLGKIAVADDIEKREELYPYPDLGKIAVADETEEKEKRSELYPYPDLGKIEVVDDVE